MLTRAFKLFLSITIVLTFTNTLITRADNSPKYKFVGAKTCSMCHKKAKDGEQFKIWKNSAHAKAYKTLESAEANKIAKASGVGDVAAKADACLKCHAPASQVDSKLLGKKFKIEDGVQCENCHGAGEKYKSKKVMKNHAKAVAKGLHDFKSDKDIEAMCKGCHNSESPTYKDFNFKERFAKIVHNIPKKK